MMDAQDIKIGTEVWIIRKYGNNKTGFDMQIVKEEVGYKGKYAFIPYYFHNLDENYQVIPYDICYKDLEEAKRNAIKMCEKYYDVIEIKPQYGGRYYDLVLKDKTNIHD